ncbi:hypothetical protein CUJ91_08865 [Paraburkholderia graminis]|nr:hypothetical protein CUJ91_08865 [Paraburkholderia graminis]
MVACCALAALPESNVERDAHRVYARSRPTERLRGNGMRIRSTQSADDSRADARAPAFESPLHA